MSYALLETELNSQPFSKHMVTDGECEQETKPFLSLPPLGSRLSQTLSAAVGRPPYRRSMRKVHQDRHVGWAGSVLHMSERTCDRAWKPTLKCVDPVTFLTLCSLSIPPFPFSLPHFPSLDSRM